MLGVMLQKLWHKKWMVICLLLGSVLLAATVVCFPMYRNAAYDRMLQDEFEGYLEESGEWPALNSMIMVSKKDAGGNAMSQMEEFVTRGIYGELGVEPILSVMHYSLSLMDAHSLLERGGEGDFELRLGFMTDLGEHARIISGRMYSESGRDENGYIEAVISEAAMVKQNLLLGEVIEFEYFQDENGDPVRVVITGVFEEQDRSDFYWQISPESLNVNCLLNEAVFKECFTGERAGKYTITCNYFTMFDYTQIKAADVDHIRERARYLLDESRYRGTMSEPAYTQILEGYAAKRTRINTTLSILQIPVLVMLCAFLVMISSQMYEMERNEISVLKSRGASGGQIFRLYLYQSIFLSLIGGAGGLFLGEQFCRLLGSADNFLQFNFERELTVSYSVEVFIYLGAAIAGSVLIMTIPAIRHSRVTIVKLKQQKAAKKYSFWERFFLDFIFLGISLYGYYNYSSNQSVMTEKALMGETMDPLLYISSSLFILGCGMLMLRLQRLLVTGIYHAGKSLWRPASYASFMEIMKNGRKQQFIMLFMILTISLGMFHATVARTILQNARDNEEYLCGADLIVEEVWKNNAGFTSGSTGENVEFQYYEPDFSKYASMTGAKSYTRVIVDTQASLSRSAKEKYVATVMGIHTKEFGENTYLSDSLLNQPYYQYLNDLALEPNGVLVSSNVRADFDYNVGDSISFMSRDGFTATGKILAFVDYWPGYEPSTMTLNEDGKVVTNNNYLIVANIGTLQRLWGITPYQVWITVRDGEDSGFIYQWLNERDVSVREFADRDKEIDGVMKDPLLQGTNGILTLSFIVTIILCAVGYLIYWIMSIRSREMVFGVLRAGGLHKGEIFHMLILEQVFSGIFSIFAGFGIGKVSSDMFVPILQNSYAAANQVLPMKLITSQEDLTRLYGVTAAAMAVCLLVITMIVFKLNVAKALKLGEE